MKISRAATTIACRLRLAREPAGPRARGAGLACFLPDGRLPAVPARDGQLPVSGPGQALAAYADLSGQSGHPRGDMVVDGRVMPYIGNTGFGSRRASSLPVSSLTSAPTARSARPPAGSPSPTAWPAPRTARRSSSPRPTPTGSPAFDTTADGSLAGQRVWADLPAGLPDGICLDAAGAGITTGPRPESKACGAAARRVVVAVQHGGVAAYRGEAIALADEQVGRDRSPHGVVCKGYAASKSSSTALMTTGHVGAEVSATEKCPPSTSSRRASWPAARAVAT
jgi:hypothetical protein